MRILFRTQKLRKLCNSFAALRKKYGQHCAEIIRRRLDDLDAAAALEDMRELPGRCHELTANRKGQLALDLAGPYRLTFEPANEPVPLKPDGGLDWSEVTAVRILHVEDYHG